MNEIVVEAIFLFYPWEGELYFHLALYLYFLLEQPNTGGAMKNNFYVMVNITNYENMPLGIAHNSSQKGSFRLRDSIM